MTDDVLIVDLGSSSCRIRVAGLDGTVRAERRLAMRPKASGVPGHVEWDGAALADAIISAAREVTRDHPVAHVAITNQRTTCLLWERQGSRVLGPVLGWADSRTLDVDRMLRRQDPTHPAGRSLAKWRWLLDQYDPDRRRSLAGELCAGTLDSWLVWVLSLGRSHRTDVTNAAHTGLLDLETLRWDADRAALAGIPLEVMPEISESTGVLAQAASLPGSPTVRVVIGDQQASLIGQGCEQPGATSITLGTVGAIDQVTSALQGQIDMRTGYPTVMLQTDGETRFGIESSVQSAGSTIDWLVRIGVLRAPEEIDLLVDPTITPGQVVFVPALDGLGAPHWKFDARASFTGLSSADGREQIVRAVLDGLACAIADVLDRMEAEGTPISSISVNGGLAASDAMMRILAATSGRPLERSADIEATSRGAALLVNRSLGKPPLNQRHSDVFGTDEARPANRHAWRKAITAVLDERRDRLAMSAAALT